MTVRNKNFIGKKRRSSSLAALMLLILVITVSCAAELDPRESVATSQEVTKAPALTEEDLSAYAPLPLIASRYSIIYGSNAPDKVRLAAEELAGKIAEAENTSLSVYTDVQAEVSRLELLIGETDRPESIEAAESLGCMDYTVRIHILPILIILTINI